MIVLLSTQGEPVGVLPGVVASMDPNQHWYVLASRQCPCLHVAKMSLHPDSLSEVALYCVVVGLRVYMCFPPSYTHTPVHHMN